MTELQRQIQKPRVRNISVIITVLIVCTSCPFSSVARGASSNWLDWLFTLFSADRVPQRPTLTEEDHQAIEKARILLQDYKSETSNSIMLGVLAAACGDANQANMHFEQAHELDISGSLLPLTMAAQTFMQEGEYGVAKSMHQRVLKISLERPASPASQKVNAYLDLTVACSKLNQRDEAMVNAERAEELIRNSQLTVAEKAFAYLQSGVVYKDVLHDDDAALRVWMEAQDLSESPESRLTPRLTLELNLKLIENLPDVPLTASLDGYLENARKALNKLSDESRIIAETRIGEQLAKRVVDGNDTSAAKLFSSRAKALLDPVWRVDIEQLDYQMIRIKDRAIQAAERLARVEKDEAKLEKLAEERKKFRGDSVIRRLIHVEKQAIKPG